MGFSLFGDIITPIHGIVLGPVEVNRDLPLASPLENAHLLHRLLVIPDDTDLIDDGAMHKGITIEVLHKLGIIARTSVSNCNEAESL